MSDGRARPGFQPPGERGQVLAETTISSPYCPILASSQYSTGMALPNLWKLYNLQSSPYFQAALHQGSTAPSTRLFVGRERRQLLSTIGGGRSSRQAVAGRPGLGKATLVQAVKADALAADYWVADELISITPGSSSEVLLGQLLAGAYDAVLACKPDAAGAAVEAAQQLVRSIRLRHWGASRSAAGFGGGGSRSEMVSSPPSALVLDGPRVLRDLLRYASTEGAQGVLLHLNNLENLGEVDAERAGDVLRGIRDQALLLDGLHLIVVGATDAVRTVVQRHTQVRSVFSNLVVLDPLALPDVYKLLEHRYQALQLDPNRSWRAPVTDAVVEQLYGLFRGDLRGMLKSLEDGMQDLLGLTIVGNEALPIGPDDLRSVLKGRNQLELEERLGGTYWERVLRWAATDPAARRTQSELARLWRIRQPSVSQTLQQLTAAGAVEALPRCGREPIQYLLTGTTRLAI